MTNMTTTTKTTDWTYDGYWNVVLGDDRDPGRVLGEFDLRPEGLDEWLGHAEAEAWSMGGIGGDPPESWASFHARALAELHAEFSGQP